MNKTEIKREINRRFYIYVETNFPQYELDFEGGYGRVYLIPKKGNKADNSIEYHQSHHDVICFNYATKQTHEDVAQMQLYINNNIIPFVKLIIED